MPYYVGTRLLLCISLLSSVSALEPRLPGAGADITDNQSKHHVKHSHRRAAHVNGQGSIAVDSATDKRGDTFIHSMMSMLRRELPDISLFEHGQHGRDDPVSSDDDKENDAADAADEEKLAEANDNDSNNSNSSVIDNLTGPDGPPGERGDKGDTNANPGYMSMTFLILICICNFCFAFATIGQLKKKADMRIKLHAQTMTHFIIEQEHKRTQTQAKINEVLTRPHTEIPDDDDWGDWGDWDTTHYTDEEWAKWEAEQAAAGAGSPTAGSASH